MAHQRGDRVNRHHDKRWTSAAERARVAAELLQEAESLTDTANLATPADVARDGQPPPLAVELPRPAAATPPTAPATAAPPPEPTRETAPDPDVAMAALHRSLAAGPEKRAFLLRRTGFVARTGARGRPPAGDGGGRGRPRAAAVRRDRSPSHCPPRPHDLRSAPPRADRRGRIPPSPRAPEGPGRRGSGRDGGWWRARCGIR